MVCCFFSLSRSFLGEAIFLPFLSSSHYYDVQLHVPHHSWAPEKMNVPAALTRDKIQKFTTLHGISKMHASSQVTSEYMNVCSVEVIANIRKRKTGRTMEFGFRGSIVHGMDIIPSLIYTSYGMLVCVMESLFPRCCINW